MLNLRNPVPLALWQDVPFWEEFNPFWMAAKLSVEDFSFSLFFLFIAKERNDVHWKCGRALESFMEKDYHHPSFYFFGAKAFLSSRQLLCRKKCFVLSLQHRLML